MISNKYEIGAAIKRVRLNKGLSAVALSQLANVAKSSLSEWENGKTQPSADALFRICDALGVMPSDLISENNNESNNISINNVATVKKMRVPVLGRIACGQPIYAENTIECYVDSFQNTHCDFALWAKGDSMINARIFDGDFSINWLTTSYSS